MVSEEKKAITTQIKKFNRIPTGIYSFDSIIRGGFPSGSLVLLSGEVGAGNKEFAYTSAAMLSILKNDPAKYGTMIKQLNSLLIKDENLKLPDNICYISFNQSKESFIMELERSFAQEFPSSLKNIFFKDFSSKYFKKISLALDSKGNWPTNKKMTDEDHLNLLKDLISELDLHAPNSIVIIDSLTKLIRACDFDWRFFILFLENLQSRSKKWDGLVYLLLGKGILANRKEEEIMDLVDGVLVFEWVQDGFSRQQAIHMRKFIGLMPHIANDNIVRFDTAVTDTDGFMVINVRHISGRK